MLIIIKEINKILSLLYTLNFINGDIKSKLKFMKPSMVQYYENDEKGKKISKIITAFYAIFINKTLEEVEKDLEKHISETKYKIYQMKDISKRDCPNNCVNFTIA